MSQRPIARSPDLKRLRDEGYNLQIVEGYLVVRDVPYLNGKGEIKHGILVCALSAVNDIAMPPGDHTAHFIGDYPCHADGSQMSQVVNSPNDVQINKDLRSNFYLSAKPKPADNYKDFHHKITTYCRLFGGPAQEKFGPCVTAKTFAVMRDDMEDEDAVFLYSDTASSRADLVAVNNKVKLKRIAILGLGGTGGHVLDLVAKTHVREIHLFDGDKFLQHNAFRAPGAASGDDLEKQSYKVDYFHGIYSKMRRGIVPHSEFITTENLHKLEGMDFVFICMESGPVKRPVIEKLISLGIPFVEVGMGIYERNGTLGGILRTTAGSAAQHDHVWDRIPLSDGGIKNEYDKNVQVVELNALHASLAVLKWKRMFGFYADQIGEHYSAFVIGRNDINNEDIGIEKGAAA